MPNIKIKAIPVLLIAFLFPTLATSATFTRQASGWGPDRDRAVANALKSTRSQISGVDAYNLGYQVLSEKQPQEQYWVALRVQFPDRPVSEVEGWGDERNLAIRDALTSAVAMTYGVEISAVQLSEKTETDAALFQYYDQKSKSQVSGRVSGYEIIDEKPKQLVYYVRLQVQFRTFDNWRAGCYSLLPGGGLIYKRWNLLGFAYLGAEAGLLTAAYLSRGKAQDNRAKKSNPNYTFDQRDFYYDQEVKFHRQNQVFIGLAAGIYALNFAHALLVKPNTNEDVLLPRHSHAGGNPSKPEMCRGCVAADDNLHWRKTYIPYIAVNQRNATIGLMIGF